jgi:hypothetical protein
MCENFILLENFSLNFFPVDFIEGLYVAVQGREAHNFFFPFWNCPIKILRQNKLQKTNRELKINHKPQYYHE